MSYTLIKLKLLFMVLITISGCFSETKESADVVVKRGGLCKKEIPKWWKNHPTNGGSALTFFEVKRYLGEFPRDYPGRCRELNPFLDSLKAGEVEVDKRDERGRTALMYELLYHDDQKPSGFMKWLVKNGASVNNRDSEQVTPIYWSRNTETTEWLLEKGANIKNRDVIGRTPFMARCGGNAMTKKEKRSSSWRRKQMFTLRTSRGEHPSYT